ncbi:hypothetical protein C8F04DRAFT_1398622 [Mycena alexandri]|uniref:Uncharacterized protein n=1 Tax=Mycena alexandri TaxID=1745969 RepID=A0AAD6SJZ2_9AGAR|nr:hypothetical protein C8F04DRAFT_1398622 [Mycena alexandri]
MQPIPLLLAACGVAIATVPTLSSFSTPGCHGTALATWSGVAEDAICKPKPPGVIALNITAGASDKNCQIDLYRSYNCDGSNGAGIGTVADTTGCYTSTEAFASVRILCITGG